MSESEYYRPSSEVMTSLNGEPSSPEWNTRTLQSRVNALIENLDRYESSLGEINLENGRNVHVYASVDNQVAFLKYTNSVRIVPPSGSEETPVVKTTSSVFALNNTEDINNIMSLFQSYKNVGQGKGIGELPITRATVIGSALGYAGVATSTFFEGIQRQNVDPGLQVLVSLTSPEYIGADLLGMSAIGIAAAGLALVRTKTLERRLSNKASRIMRRLERQIDSLISQKSTTHLSSAPNIMSGMDDAVMAMIIRDPEPKIFWRAYASAAVSKIETYDKQIEQLKRNIPNKHQAKQSDEDDGYILQFKGQRVLDVLIKLADKRRTELMGNNK